jgi:hypothetical protein
MEVEFELSSHTQLSHIERDIEGHALLHNETEAAVD